MTALSTIPAAFDFEVSDFLESLRTRLALAAPYKKNSQDGVFKYFINTGSQVVLQIGTDRKSHRVNTIMLAADYDGPGMFQFPTVLNEVILIIDPGINGAGDDLADDDPRRTKSVELAARIFSRDLSIDYPEHQEVENGILYRVNQVGTIAKLTVGVTITRV